MLPNFDHLDNENIHLHKTVTFYTDSKFFTVFYTLLCCLPIQKKLDILKQSHNNELIAHAENWTFRFHKDQREEYRLNELLKGVMFYDFIQECEYSLIVISTVFASLLEGFEFDTIASND